MRTRYCRTFVLCLMLEIWLCAVSQGQARPHDSLAHIIETVKHGDYATVRKLLTQEGDLSRWDLPTQKAVMQAAFVDGNLGARVDILELLISQGAMVNFVSKQGETPLICGIFWRYLPLVRVCLEKGAAINAMTPFGYSAVQMAAAFGIREMLPLLLTAKADMKTANMVGDTPFMSAAGIRNYNHSVGKIDDTTDCLRYVWERTRQDHPISKHEYDVALLHAAQAENEANVAFLLMHGADPSATVWSDTALLKAIRFKSTDIVDLLLDMGAAFDIRTREGSTPLALAHMSDPPEAERMVQSLLRHGAKEPGANKTSFPDDGNQKPSIGSLAPTSPPAEIPSDTLHLKLLPQEAAAKIGFFTLQRLTLSAQRPASVRTVPADVIAPQYATLTIGPKESPTALIFLLDEAKGRESRLWVDSGGKGDLAATAPIVWSKQLYQTQNGNSYVTYEGNIAVPLHFGDQTCTVHIGLSRFDKTDPGRSAFANSLLYYRDYACEGSIKLGDTLYPVMISDDQIRGDFRSTLGVASGLHLLIDVNQNGRFDQVGEIYDLNRPFTIRGNTYQLTGTDVFGQVYQVRKSTQSVAEIPPTGSWEVGDFAPPFSARTTSNQAMRFPDTYRGKIVLLVFWSTWRGPQVEHIPNLMRMYQQYHEKGFEVLGISLDEPNVVLKVASVAQKEKTPWVQIDAGKGWEAPLAQLYDVHSFPKLYLVDGDTGKILAENRDLLGEALQKTVEEILAKRR